MRLLTYRLDTTVPTNKHQFLNALYKEVLHLDNMWHFFLDPDGGTLRFQAKFEKQVIGFLEKHAKSYGIAWDKRSWYDPKKHEYWGVSYLGEDILPMFHEMSVICLKYPSYVVLRPFFERLNHGLINMVGVHDFAVESELYMNLAEGRARLIGGTVFKLPKTFYKNWYKIVGILDRIKEK